MENPQTVEQKPSEILKKAKQLLIEKGWTQKAYARDSEQLPTCTRSSEATCFCMVGALTRVSDEVTFETFKYFGRASSSLAGLSIINWNDVPGRTKEDVLAKFDEAIALAESEGN